MHHHQLEHANVDNSTADKLIEELKAYLNLKATG